ncbi:MAG: tetratricopeptide repeat protein [Bryobacteraceae bacterium]
MRLLLPLLVCLAAFANQDPVPEFEKVLQAGRDAYSRGQYASSLATFEKAWKLVEQADFKDPKRYDALEALTSANIALKKYDEAEAWLQLAINWREVAISRTDPSIADEYVKLIGILRGKKEFERALFVAQQARFMRWRPGMSENIRLAEDTARLGLIHLDMEQPDAALDDYRQALGVLDRVIGPDHPQVLPMLDRVGELENSQRAYDRAEATFRRALVIRERIHGGDHADLIATLDGLAYSLFGQRRYDDAEPVYKRLLGIWEVSAGPEHPMVALTLDKIATFYSEQGKLEESQAAVDRSLAIRTGFLTGALSEEAKRQLVRERKAEAKAVFTQAVDAMEVERKKVVPEEKPAALVRKAAPVRRK